MIPTLFVHHLTPEEVITLSQLHNNHPKTAPRRRAHIILLNNMGFPIVEITKICRCNRQTVAKVIHLWDRQGIAGLFDKPRSGRPKILSAEQEVIVIDMVEQTPQRLKSVINEINKKMNINISISLVKRLCKRAKMSWRRIRKSLKNKRNEEEFRRSKAMIESLIIQENNQEIDLYFFDGSAFSLLPPVPYAWQKKGQTIEVPSSRSPSINVLGFVNRACQFESFAFEGSVTSSVIIACIDEFAENIKKPTTIIIDNAPTHTSRQFKAQLSRWQALGLTIQPIAAYSPELNIIEIVWRMIKYQWLSFSAYESFEALQENLFDVLANIGKEYHINFA